MPRERKGVSKPKSKTEETRRYFVIASEGADTERIYFEGLKEFIQEKGIYDSLIKIEFLKRKTEKERVKSSHKAIVKQLDAYKKTFQIDERDELWLVIDRDKQNNPTKNIAAIAQSCQQKGYFLALSNPNFELWLLLHIADLGLYTSSQLEDLLENKKVNATKNYLDFELTKVLGSYNKTKYDAKQFFPFIQDAIKRAKDLDLNPNDRWIEGSLGTRVYRLAENIFTK
jgi:RloB-like protein